TSTGTWSSATLSLGRADLSATSAGGIVFFGGGNTVNLNTNVVDIYNTSTGTWSVANLSQVRSALSATSAGSMVFFAGGGNAAGMSSVVDIYDTSAGTWSVANLSQARANLSATSAGNQVFFAGGVTGAYVITNVVDIYNTSTGTWSVATLSHARGDFSATSAGNKVFFAGGESSSSPSNVVDIYDTSTGTWSAATLSRARYYFSATSAGNQVFFAGGDLGNESPSNVVDIYTLQNYPSISSTKTFTLVDNTTVTGRMQLGGGSLGLANFNLAVGSMAGSAPIDLGNGTLTTGSDNTTTIYCGAITGNGSLVMNGTGTLALTGAVSSGAITVNQGQIIAGPGSVVAGNLTIPAGGRFTYNGSSLFVSNLSNGGTFIGGGQVGGNFVNQSSGDVRIAAGQGLYIQNGGPQSNSGLVEVLGTGASPAQFESAGPFTNASGSGNGMIAAQNATLHFDGGLTNQAALAFSYGVSNVFGKITNSPGGNISIAGGAGVTFYGDMTQDGTLVVSSVGNTHSSAVFFGAFSGGGGFSGGGDVFLMGDLRPGDPAEITFGGNAFLSNSTDTVMELAGPMPGSQYDRIDVTGQLDLAGALDVVLLDGFGPQAGEAFKLFDGAMSGTFSRVSLPALSNGLSWDTSNLYATGTISVTPEPSALALLGIGVIGLLGCGWLQRKQAVVAGGGR
ncbi:MAG: kelch repeat-containing protein, partial [Thermoguttaceae bacterium]